MKPSPISCLLIQVYLLLFSTSIQAQLPVKNDVSSKLYSSTQLQLDFQQLRYGLETIQTGLYDYTDKKQFDGYLDSIAATLNRPMSEWEFYKKVVSVIAQIRSGHSAAWLSKDQPGRSIPLYLIFLNSRIYSGRDLSGLNAIPDGSEILAINGQASGDIIHTLLKNIPGDGYNQTFRIRMLQKIYFNFHYALFIDRPDSFRVTFRPYQGDKIKVVQLPALDDSTKNLNDRFKYGNKPYPFAFAEKKAFTLSFQGKRPEVAILTIKRFFTVNDEPRSLLDSFLAQSFRQIKERGTKNLIIDVRDNGGGDNKKVALLYSYLTDSSFTLNRAMEVTNLNYSAFHEGNYNYNQYTYKQDHDGRIQVTDGTTSLKPFLPQPGNFKGKVYVLMDGGSYSATSQFISMLHSGHRASFIGEECGGAYGFVTGGRSVYSILKYTGIKVISSPLKEIFDVKEYDPKSNLKPGYPVISSIEDFINNTDKQLQFAIKLIEESAR